MVQCLFRDLARPLRCRQVTRILGAKVRLAVSNLSQRVESAYLTPYIVAHAINFPGHDPLIWMEDGKDIVDRTQLVKPAIPCRGRERLAGANFANVHWEMPIWDPRGRQVSVIFTGIAVGYCLENGEAVRDFPRRRVHIEVIFRGNLEKGFRYVKNSAQLLPDRRAICDRLVSGPRDWWSRG